MDKTAVSQHPDWKTGKSVLKNELLDLFGFLSKQVFNQVPSVSALAGLLAGAWVMSNFTASPIRGTLAEWGLIEGGTRVVSSATYKFMAVALPIMATAVTAYAVNKALQAFREMQIELSQSRAARLPEETKATLQVKLDALEAARAQGILSWGESRAKMVNIYRQFTGGRDSKARRAIISRVGAKIQ